MQSIVPINLPKGRRKKQLSKRTASELKEYLNLTSKLNLHGHCVPFQAAFAAIHLQQFIGRLTVSYIATADKVLLEIESLILKSVMLHTPNQADPCFLDFSDASQGFSCYVQTGYLSGLYLPAGGREYSMHWTGPAQIKRE